MSTERYDDLVLGSGAGGKLLSWHLARAGRRTAVVERRYIGGSCPNINCLPSKNEVWSAKVADLIRHAAAFGVVTGSTAIDMRRVRQRKRDMVDGLVAMHLDQYRASGAELIMGAARFVGPKTLEVRLNEGGTRTVEGERLFLNVGTHAAIPPIPGLADARPLTNIELLELDRLPEHLVVLGGGYVGLEFAQAYRRFGSRVTVIQNGEHLLSREDPDVPAELRRILARDGIDILLAADVLHMEAHSADGLRLRVPTAGRAHTIAASDVRRPHSRLHDCRPGGGGSDGRRADGDARRTALHGLLRRDPHAPDDGGRPERPVRRRPAGAELISGGGTVPSYGRGSANVEFGRYVARTRKG